MSPNRSQRIYWDEIILGVIVVQSRQKRGQSQNEMGNTVDRTAIAKLAGSGEAKRLMELLEQRGGVQTAARAAADGDPSQLMAMMSQLMQTKEGAELVDRIGAQAKKAGLQ